MMKKNISEWLRMKTMFCALILLGLPDAFNNNHSNGPVMIGAQVYIEPGQSHEEIEHYFKLLKTNHMSVCRIRMDESHMKKEDGSFDFSLYQKAFDEAARNGISVFATLFPGNLPSAEDEYGGVGGFKFPVSVAHQESIARYIKEVVTHFSKHPALKVWVLQNEPGVAGNMPNNDFSREKFSEWKNKQPPEESYNDYMQVQYTTDVFMRDYTTWYLQWIAEKVRLYDQQTELHVNPHMIFANLADYDFDAWHDFVSHIGASMHPSWHFGFFTRKEFPLAMAANCEILRTGAKPLPFWVTELQGGNNNFSAFNPIMPSESEIAHWMWTSIAAGASGIIFWTLNPRAAGLEAGEWALTDFQRNATPRLKMAGKIAGILEKNLFLQKIQPSLSDIYLVYSPESVIMQRTAEIRSDLVNQEFAARMEGGHIKSVLAWYRVFNENGVGAQIFHMDQFDWEKEPQGKTVILSNMAMVPRRHYQKMKSFVQMGGTLIVSGQSLHFDEYGFNVMYGEWPLKDLFGASIKEFQTRGRYFNIHLEGKQIGAHFMAGIINNESADIIGMDENGHPTATINHYGQGKVVWVPSMIGLAAWEQPDDAFVDFVLDHSKSAASYQPFLLQQNTPGLLIRHFHGKDGLYSLVINQSGEKQILLFDDDYRIAKTVFKLHDPLIGKSSLTVSEDECIVFKWENKE